jgi:hypothetical protein
LLETESFEVAQGPAARFDRSSLGHLSVSRCQMILPVFSQSVTLAPPRVRAVATHPCAWPHPLPSAPLAVVSCRLDRAKSTAAVSVGECRARVNELAAERARLAGQKRRLVLDIDDRIQHAWQVRDRERVRGLGRGGREGGGGGVYASDPCWGASRMEGVMASFPRDLIGGAPVAPRKVLMGSPDLGFDVVSSGCARGGVGAGGRGVGRRGGGRPQGATPHARAETAHRRPRGEGYRGMLKGMHHTGSGFASNRGWGWVGAGL